MLSFKQYYTTLFVLFITGIFISSCGDDYHRNKAHPEISESRIKKGRVLAAKYCGSCHALPDPSLLDVKSWEMGVLPAMGPYLGVFQHNFKEYPSSMNDKDLPDNFYPAQAVVKGEEWQNIIDYYVATSPDSLLPNQTKKTIEKNLSLFKAEVPSYSYENPAISFSKFGSAALQQQLVVCDLIRQKLFRFDASLKLIDSINSTGSIVDIEFLTDKIVACDIGVINPTNGKFGRSFLLSSDPLNHLKADTQHLFNKLARPVQMVSADLNKDGRMDYAVCEFGHLTGAFSWIEDAGSGKYIRHELSSSPGAINAWVNDYNKDGLPDIWVLFAQGKERIMLYTNKGNSKFDQREILNFPAVYGSTSFELCDFNNDGFQDIVYTCGDNADYSMVLKPYHGVYIFLNDGSNNFKQKYFYPINGCFKAIPRDYDKDGDLDIATIAFFADYAHEPKEGFVYLENKNNFEFEPYIFPESLSGRWLTMDADDVDGDGRIDIVLGNFSVRPTNIPVQTDWTKGPPFILLRNIGNKGN